MPAGANGHRAQSSLAGPRHCRRPALLFLFGLCAAGFSLPAFAQQGATDGGTTHCDELPEARQALCWMVVACGALDDEGRRAECYRIAVDSLQHGGVPPAPASTADAQEEEVPPPAPAVVRSEPRPVAPAKSPPTPASQPSEVTTKTVLQEVLDIPKRFSAQVTAQRRLVRNRQLLVLDDKLLFETDNADSASIDVGDTVDVVKASSLRGRSYQIVGPSKRATTGLRIRCERSDLSVGNRRKCGVLASRNEATPD